MSDYPAGLQVLFDQLGLVPTSKQETERQNRNLALWHNIPWFLFTSLYWLLLVATLLGFCTAIDAVVTFLFFDGDAGSIALLACFFIVPGVLLLATLCALDCPAIEKKMWQHYPEWREAAIPGWVTIFIGQIREITGDDCPLEILRLSHTTRHCLLLTLGLSRNGDYQEPICIARWW